MALGNEFWQIGLMVPDLEAAMDELGRTLGLEWCEVKSFGTEDEPLPRVVISRQGPPYFELVQGPDGSPWDSSSGPRLDHLAFWTDDLSAERSRLEAAGAPVVMDGQASGMLANYHALPASGFRIEPIDASVKPDIRRDWSLDNIG